MRLRLMLISIGFYHRVLYINQSVFFCFFFVRTIARQPQANDETIKISRKA